MAMHNSDSTDKLESGSGFCLSSKTRIDDTGFGYTLSLLSGRYKIIILYWLSEYKAVMRFNELHRQIGNISHKTLSNTLKELQADEGADYPHGISADSTQSGVFTISARAFTRADYRGNVPLG